jgi:hypothetical protein
MIDFFDIRFEDFRVIVLGFEGFFIVILHRYLFIEVRIKVIERILIRLLVRKVRIQVIRFSLIGD